MRAFATFTLGLGLIVLLGTSVRSDDKKEEKKAETKAETKLEGKYTLVGGKRNDKPIDDESKKAEYTFTADKVTIKGKDASFVMSYKLDPKTNPMEIDMEIVDGPDGTKGAKAAGIVELKGDTLKLAYSMDKDKDDKLKRPKNFDGKEGMAFEFKKAK
jgi:uncharacterized protein (TIGR03067 family)